MVNNVEVFRGFSNKRAKKIKYEVKCGSKRGSHEVKLNVDIMVNNGFSDKRAKKIKYEVKRGYHGE